MIVCHALFFTYFWCLCVRTWLWTKMSLWFACLIIVFFQRFCTSISWATFYFILFFVLFYFIQKLKITDLNAKLDQIVSDEKVSICVILTVTLYEVFDMKRRLADSQLFMLKMHQAKKTHLRPWPLSWRMFEESLFVAWSIINEINLTSFVFRNLYWPIRTP